MTALHRQILAQLLREFVHCDDPSDHGLSVTQLRNRLRSVGAAVPTPTEIRLALRDLPALIAARHWQFTIKHEPSRPGHPDRWRLELSVQPITQARPS